MSHSCVSFYLNVILSTFMSSLTSSLPPFSVFFFTIVALLPSHLLIFVLLLSFTPSFPSLQVWFQNRRMKDKRQRHSLPWPHPLVDPLGALLMGRTSSSTLSYPFIPPHLSHLSLHHYSPLALSSPMSSAHSPYSTSIGPLDTLRLSQYHNRPGGLPPTTTALYPSPSIMHHPASCPCPLCLHWGPEQLLKARGEALGLSKPHSPKANIQPASLERREEIV